VRQEERVGATSSVRGRESIRSVAGMETDAACTFTDRWLAAWNARDLEAILGHFSDDVVFTSPLAVRVMEGSGGVLQGKDRLREYWTAGLPRNPDLHFELIDRYDGVDTLVLNYRNARGGRVCEVLTFVGPPGGPWPRHLRGRARRRIVTGGRPTWPTTR